VSFPQLRFFPNYLWPIFAQQLHPSAFTQMANLPLATHKILGWCRLNKKSNRLMSKN